MDTYDSFDRLREIMELQECPAVLHCLCYSKMVQTGRFDICDYGRGFLELCIRSLPISGEDQQRGRYYVRLSLMTVDDGGWGAWSNPMGLDKANAIVKQVRDLVKEIVAMPTEEEFNRMLIPVGLYGINEG